MPPIQPVRLKQHFQLYQKPPVPPGAVTLAKAFPKSHNQNHIKCLQSEMICAQTQIIVTTFSARHYFYR